MFKKTGKKILTFALSLVMLTGMCASIAPVSAFSLDVSAAGETEEYGDFSFVELEDGTAKITKYNGNNTDVDIPNAVWRTGENSGMLYVSQIGENSITYNNSVERITIPDSVKLVAPNAIQNCSNIKYIAVMGEDTILQAHSIGFISRQEYSANTHQMITNYYKQDIDIYTATASCSAANYVKGNGFSNYVVLSNTSEFSDTAVVVDKEFNINASAEGGKGSLEIQVKIQKRYTVGSSHIRFRYEDYYVFPSTGGTQASYDYAFESSGYYRIVITAKDENGFEATKYIAVQAYYPLVNDSTISAEKIDLGESVTVTAKAFTGRSPYQYAVYYKQTSQTSWTCAQNYGTNTTVTITPKAAKTYTVRVKVKDASDTIVNKDFKVTVSKATELANTSKISATSIALGSNVKVTASATGGKTPYQYAVYYKQTSQTSWTCAQSYGTNTTLTITPKAATIYTVRVKVKDAADTIVNKDFKVTVSKAAELANTSKLSATSIALGSNVKVTASAKGGKTPYQYAVYYKQTSQTSWTCAQSYGTNTTVTITPKAATTYTVRVKVKDAAGTIVNKDHKITVTKE